MNLCKSVKSLKQNIQCPHKVKDNESFCGIHLKSKNPIIFNQNILSDFESININHTDDNQHNLLDIIYSKDKLFEIINLNKHINIGTLRKSIKSISELKCINRKQSKQNLINNLKIYIEKERFYMLNIISIIKIQKIYRMHRIYMRKICSNSTDILTFESIFEIPSKYFYIFNDNKTNKKYGYDIRTLIEIINSEYVSCPYTFRSFSKDEIDKINLYKNRLIKDDININIDKIELSPQEETDMKIKDLFYQINMLDNYTDPDWFRNLNYMQLFTLYHKAEDIWNYRSNMTLESKKKIIKNGIAFNIPSYILKTFKNFIKMQNIIIDEFMRLITEGVDRDERKLGAILVLTALVEVSGDAANALPHLVQL